MCELTLQGNGVTNYIMVNMTVVALDELYSLGIGIRGLADDFPFWDTNAFGPKRKISTSALPWLIVQPFWIIYPHRHVVLGSLKPPGTQ
jgi:hypothetical protein